MIRQEVISRAASAIRDVQRRCQATRTEMALALEELGDVEADVLPRDLEHDEEAACPRCGRWSRSARVAGSCSWCGATWAEEGAAQPRGGVA